ncbi:YbaK/EbsC family protein [Bartonella tamiae]
MRKDPQPLFDFLNKLEIVVTTHYHEALFKVSEGEQIKAKISGGHTKKFFLKDKKGQYFLVILEDYALVDLKQLHKIIGASGRLSFGSAEKLSQYLGLYPGAVSVFGLLNDKENHVRLILDKDLMQNIYINCHPLTNEATTSIHRDDLLKFVEATHHDVRILHISQNQGLN